MPLYNVRIVQCIKKLRFSVHCLVKVSPNQNNLISDSDFVYIYDMCNVVQMFMPVVVHRMY